MNFGPLAEARELARQYMSDRGLIYKPIQVFTSVVKERARRIAYAYDELKSDPFNSAVMISYRHLIYETLSQYEYFLQAGVKVEIIEQGSVPPYPRLEFVLLDIIENKHLWVQKTEPGSYGPDDSIFEEPNLLLEPTDFFIGEARLLVNDIFRIVHDYFGHVKEGVLFGYNGEENAWRGHSTMYSRSALGAMTSELRGQNSWTNFGPYGDHNRTASQALTKYAPQKNNLMPEWTWDEGREDP